MNDKVVVLGSNSFTGSHFVRHLLKQGYEVIGISRSAESTTVPLPYQMVEPRNFQFHQLDLNKQLSKIVSLIGRLKPRYLVNFAAQSMIGESWQLPTHWYQTNTLSTIALHERLTQIDFLDKYVHVSTPEVYGHRDDRIIENRHYQPLTPMATSRAAADMSLMNFYEGYHFPVVFTRSANIYGPGQALFRIVPRTIMSFLAGRSLQLHGGGQSVRSFVYVEDVCSATCKIMEQAAPPEIYHISGEHFLKVRALVDLIGQQLGVPVDQLVEAIGEGEAKEVECILCSKKLRTTLDWKDQVELQDGISITIEWIKQNYSLLSEQPLRYNHKP